MGTSMVPDDVVVVAAVVVGVVVVGVVVVGVVVVGVVVSVVVVVGVVVGVVVAVVVVVGVVEGAELGVIHSSKLSKLHWPPVTAIITTMLVAPSEASALATACDRLRGVHAPAVSVGTLPVVAISAPPVVRRENTQVPVVSSRSALPKVSVTMSPGVRERPSGTVCDMEPVAT